MERVFILVFSTLVGIAIGSFLNVVVLRTHASQGGILTGKSECPKCKHTLSFWDLVPVLSYIFLFGRCRYCHKKISPQYVIVEVLTGLCFLLVTYFLFPSFNLFFLPFFLFYLLQISVLILISVYDYLYQEVPNRFTFPFIFLNLVFLIFFSRAPLDGIYGGLLFFIFFYLQVLIPYSIYAIKKKDTAPLKDALFFPIYFVIQIFSFRQWFIDENGDEEETPSGLVEWIGFGDFRIGVLIGILLGFKFSIVALFLSYILGAVIGVISILKNKKKTIQRIPFGPFLAISTVITLFYGQIFINFYFRFGQIIRTLLEKGAII